MAKRFVDTELFDKEWFFNLSPKLKVLVQFLRLKCDVAGVWSPNYVLATQYVGESVSEPELLSIDGGNQFLKLANGKIYCSGFIEFQYGTLSEKCRPHLKVFEAIKKHNLSDTLSHRVSDRVEEKEQEKEEEGEQEEGGLGETDFAWPGHPSFENVPEPPNHILDGIRERQYQSGKNKTVSREDVSAYWKIWAALELNGTKFYKDVGQVYRHFHNRCETVNIKEPEQKQKVYGAGKANATTLVIPTGKRDYGKL